MNVRVSTASTSWMRFIVLVLCVASCACTRTLPRRTVPAAEMPNVDLSRPQPEGTGRLVVDVPDGAVPVTQIAMRTVPAGEHFTFSEEPTEVCPSTPCVLDLPIGNVALAFPVQGLPGDLSTPELVHVGQTPSVFRRNLDLYVNDRRALAATGAVFTGVGVLAMIVGLLVARGAEDGSEGRDQRTFGLVTAAGGFALVLPGFAMVRRGAATREPGSSVHFPVL